MSTLQVESNLELQRVFHLSKYRLLALEQNIAALLKVTVSTTQLKLFLAHLIIVV